MSDDILKVSLLDATTRARIACMPESLPGYVAPNERIARLESALKEIAAKHHADRSCSLEAQGYDREEIATIIGREECSTIARIALGIDKDHPTHHAKYRATPALFDAIDRMIAHETCGGDGWWNAWHDIKQARSALPTPATPVTETEA